MSIQFHLEETLLTMVTEFLFGGNSGHENHLKTCLIMAFLSVHAWTDLGDSPTLNSLSEDVRSHFFSPLESASLSLL